jgi:hypothetical protein
MTTPNFARLATDRPEISRLVTAMLQARQAIVQRSWSHPQEDSSDDWWADVLADPRARRPTRAQSGGTMAIYRLRDEGAQPFSLPAPSAIGRRLSAAPTLSQSTVPIAHCRTCWLTSLLRGVLGSAPIGTAAPCTTLSRSREAADDHAHHAGRSRRLHRHRTRY